MKQASVHQLPWSERRIHRSFYLLLAAYFALQVLARLSIGDSLELDEAEQAFLSQWFLLGYGSKPPLYTWLQIGLNSLLGLSVLSLSLLKNLLLFGTYAFLYESGRLLLRSNSLAALAAASMLLIPQIGWESQRDLTHSVLVTMLAAAAVFIALLLTRKQKTWIYLAAGLVCGLGVLSKYNFLLFMAALLAGMLACTRSRRVLQDRRALWIPALTVAVAGPYGIWFALHLDTATGSMGKLEPAASGWLLPGLWSLVEAPVAFLTPFWLLFLLFFLPKSVLRRPASEHARRVRRGFHCYALSILGLFLVGIALFHVTEIKARWLQPLLFVAPVYCFMHLDRNTLPRARVKGYAMVIAGIAGLILLLLPLRTLLGPTIGYYTDQNIPYGALAAGLEKLDKTDTLLLTPDSTLGGNLKMHLEHAEIIDPIMGKQVIKDATPDHMHVSIVWALEKGTKNNIPQHIKEFLKKQAWLLTNIQHQIKSITTKYKFATKKNANYTLCYITM